MTIYLIKKKKILLVKVGIFECNIFITKLFLVF